MEFFTEVTALAALAVVAVQQILKLNAIPVFFANKYPVATNAVLSVIAAIVVHWKTAVDLTTWQEWVAYAGTVAVIAAITYNMTIRNSVGIQRVSREKSVNQTI